MDQEIQQNGPHTPPTYENELLVRGAVDNVKRLEGFPPERVNGERIHDYDTVWKCSVAGDRVDLHEVAVVICPDCGEWTGRWRNGRYNCEECNSAGTLEPEDTALEPLSDREREVVRAKMADDPPTDQEIAENLDVKPSTVREYHDRAKAKAKRGERLYDQMATYDLL